MSDIIKLNKRAEILRRELNRVRLNLETLFADVDVTPETTTRSRQLFEEALAHVL